MEYFATLKVSLHYVLFVFVGMATCYFFSLQDLPPLGRWWTQPPHTHLHQYHRSHPPLPHHLWSLVQSRYPRSRRTRLISIWPNKMAKSTGTKIPSCKSHTSPEHQTQMSDIWCVYARYRCHHGALGKCVHCVPLEVRGFSPFVWTS